MAPMILARITVFVAVGCLFSHDRCYLSSSASALMVSPRHRNANRFGIDRFPCHSATSSTRITTSVLYAASNDDGDDDTSNSQSDDGQDLDFDRKILALENMMKDVGGSSGKNDASTSLGTNSSILTSARKQRLEREIELIKQLDPDHPDNINEYSDLQNQELVVAQLWALWYGERGSMNERKLKAIEEMLNDPDLWHDAENKYLELIREHCSTDGSLDNIDLSNWVEPANRLATLYFIMGRFGESKKWCERILKTKPWHIGALSGVVMVCMRMGDKKGVIEYSLMGLPNLSDQLRNQRKEWVRKNVEFAEKNLLRLEELNQEAYGAPDEGRIDYAATESQAVDSGTINSEIEDDDSAWQ